VVIVFAAWLRATEDIELSGFPKSFCRKEDLDERCSSTSLDVGFNAELTRRFLPPLLCRRSSCDSGPDAGSLIVKEKGNKVYVKVKVDENARVKVDRKDDSEEEGEEK